MSLESLWLDAVKNTEIVQLPIKKLSAIDMSSFEYYLLAESAFKDSTTVRKGKMQITKPSLILPGGNPIFKGFESNDHANEIADKELEKFFYMRGISFPSLQYDNEIVELSIEEASLSESVKKYEKNLREFEKISSALLIGSSDSWQFSLLILACHMIEPQIEGDLRALFKKFKK